MANKPYANSSSVIIDVDQQRLYEYLSDLKHFDEWNPFSAMAKDMTSSLSAVTNEVGAKYTYSDKRMGSGEMTLTELHPNSLIRLQMKFMMPSETLADIVWSLTPVGENTQMTWTMSGERGTKDRVMNRLFGLDRMMEKHFTQGLAGLKTQLEK